MLSWTSRRRHRGRQRGERAAKIRERPGLSRAERILLHRVTAGVPTNHLGSEYGKSGEKITREAPRAPRTADVNRKEWDRCHVDFAARFEPLLSCVRGTPLRRYTEVMLKVSLGRRCDDFL